jgi:hypothetical protein
MNIQLFQKTEEFGIMWRVCGMQMEEFTEFAILILLS